MLIFPDVQFVITNSILEPIYLIQEILESFLIEVQELPQYFLIIFRFQHFHSLPEFLSLPSFQRGSLFLRANFIENLYVPFFQVAKPICLNEMLLCLLQFYDELLFYLADALHDVLLPFCCFLQSGSQTLQLDGRAARMKFFVTTFTVPTGKVAAEG